MSSTAAADDAATAAVTTVPAVPAAAPVPANPFLAGNPLALGIPVFCAGSIVLGLNLIGFMGSTPFAAPGAPLPVITVATGLGLMIAMVWALALGQSVVASIFGVFGGFWLSYALLIFGILHNWFELGSTPVATTHTEAAFLIAWLTIIGILTLGTLRLPLAFTAILFFVDLALIAVLIGVLTGPTTWLFTLGGAFAFVFAGLGSWVYLGVGMVGTGGTDVPLGKPVIGS